MSVRVEVRQSVLRWARARSGIAEDDWAAAADSALIAYALAGEHVVVTHELPANTRKRIPIRNAASSLTDAYASPWRMLREERPLFVLQGAS